MLRRVDLTTSSLLSSSTGATDTGGFVEGEFLGTVKLGPLLLDSVLVHLQNRHKMRMLLNIISCSCSVGENVQCPLSQQFFSRGGTSTEPTVL